MAALCLPLNPNIAEHGAGVVSALYAAEHVVRLERRKAAGHGLAHLDPSAEAYRNHAKRTGVNLDLMDKAAQEIREGKRPVNCLVPEPERLYIQPGGGLGPMAVA